MRRETVTVVLLALILSCFGSLAPASAQAAGYSVVVNGVTLTDAQAEMREGTLMVAVRPLVTAMGGAVYWSSANQQMTIYFGGSQMALYKGNNLAFQDGQPVWSPVKPFLKGERLMAPGWWLAKRLGAQVEYKDQTLVVKTSRQSPPIPQHPLMKSSYYFPFPKGVKYETYFDSWGDPRYFQGATSRHEGTDILTAKGNPIVAVAAGTVVRYGWNTLGGYRLMIQLDDHPEYRFYYAHMDRYASGIYLGAHVTAGQLLGYVGNTGEGPERTEGRFVPHLHFGIYDSNGSAINPYPFLKYWEGHKAW